MRIVLLIGATTLATSFAAQDAAAWMQRTPSGGLSYGSSYGGFQHSTTVGPQGISHESDLGGFEHGTAANAQGVAHASNAGGAWHGTAAGPGGVEHTGPYGTTTAAYGAYYHQPTVVNNYAAGGCYNCGSAAGERRPLQQSPLASPG